MPGPTSSRLMILCVCLLALFEGCRNIYTALELDNAWTVMQDAVVFPEIEIHKNKEAVVIGYAVSITQFTTLAQNKGREKLLDRAAVLAKSIQLAMDQSRLYDYHLFAFVHPNATECIPRIKSLGYRVQVRDTPFRLADISFALSACSGRISGGPRVRTLASMTLLASSVSRANSAQRPCSAFCSLP